MTTPSRSTRRGPPDAVSDTGEHGDWGGSLLARDDEHAYDEHGHDDRARRPRTARRTGPTSSGDAAYGRGAPGARRPAWCVLLVLGAVVGGLGFAVFAGMDKVQGLFASADDFSGEGTGSVIFEVKEGETVAAIGRNLKADGVVASVEAFTDAAAADPDSNGIQVGFYDLNEEMSADSALALLVDPDNLLQSEVTVPEGLRVEDVAQDAGQGHRDPAGRRTRRRSSATRRSGCPTTPRATRRATSSRRPTPCRRTPTPSTCCP